MRSMVVLTVVVLVLLACPSSGQQQLSTRFYQLTNPEEVSGSLATMDNPRDVKPRVRVFAPNSDIVDPTKYLTQVVANKVNLSPFLPGAKCQLSWTPPTVFTKTTRADKLVELTDALSGKPSGITFSNVFAPVDVDFLGYTLQKRVVVRSAGLVSGVTDVVVLNMEAAYFQYLDCPTLSTYNRVYAVEKDSSKLVYGDQAGSEQVGFDFLRASGDIANFKDSVETSLLTRLQAVERDMCVQESPLKDVFFQLISDWSFIHPDASKDQYLWQLPLAVVGGAVRDLYNAPEDAKDVDVAIGLPYADVQTSIDNLYQAKGTTLDASTFLHEGMRQQYGMLKVERKGTEYDGLDIGPFKSFSKEEIAIESYEKYVGAFSPTKATMQLQLDAEVALLFPKDLCNDDNAMYLFGFSYRTDTKFRDFTINSLFLEVGKYTPSATDIRVYRLVDGGRTDTNDATGDRLGRQDVKDNVMRPTGTDDEFEHDKGMWFRVWKMTNKGFCPSNLAFVESTCDKLDEWLNEVMASTSITRDEENAFFFRLRQKLYKVDGKSKDTDTQNLLAQLHRMRADANGDYKCWDVWARIFQYVKTNFAVMCPTDQVNPNLCGGDVQRFTDLTNIYTQAATAAALRTATAADKTAANAAKGKLDTFVKNQQTYRKMLESLNQVLITSPENCFMTPLFAGSVSPVPAIKAGKGKKDCGWSADSIHWDPTTNCPYVFSEDNDWRNAESVSIQGVKTKYNKIATKMTYTVNAAEIPFSLRYANELAAEALGSKLTKTGPAPMNIMGDLDNAMKEILAQYVNTGKLKGSYISTVSFTVNRKDRTGQKVQVPVTFKQLLEAAQPYYDKDRVKALQLIADAKLENSNTYNDDRRTFITGLPTAFFLENNAVHHQRRRHHRRHHRHHHSQPVESDSFLELQQQRHRRRQEKEEEGH